MTELAPVLEQAERDLDTAQSDALATLGSGSLGQVWTPDLTPGGLSRAQLRTAATVYLLQQLERAGIPAFTESMATGVASGRLWLALDEHGSRALYAYHQGADWRHTPDEREAVYSRLFGGSGSPTPNTDFGPAMRGLCRELASAGEFSGQVPVHLRTRVTVTATTLGQAVSGRAAGMTRYDSERMLAHVRESMNLLRQPTLRAALGPGAPLSVVQRQAPEILGRPVDPQALQRGMAGSTVLRWVADHASYLANAAPLRGDDAVVMAAAHWLVLEAP